MAMELCPAMRANVQASHPLSPNRVRKVWRRLYSTNDLTLESRRAFRCCLFRLHGSTWPLRVQDGHVQPSSGRLAPSQRASRMFLTLSVIGSTRRAAFVFPCITRRDPFLPFTQVIDSHRRR